jgi:DinB superfamily
MSPKTQLAGFLAKYTPAMAKEGRAALMRLRRLVPGATQMVYDTWNGLVIGFGPSDRPSDAVVSILMVPDHVSLHPRECYDFRAMTEIETAIADNRAAVDEFVAAANGIDPAKWKTPLGEGKWSPAQIAEHLAIIYEYNRKVVTGTAGKGAPKFLQPLARWFIVTRTLKAGAFTRKGRAPKIFQPTSTPEAAAPLLMRLTNAVRGFENDIRSGHPEGRHTVAHPFFGTLPTVDYLRLQAIHARHHRSQLT